MRALKLQKSLEMGNFGNERVDKGVPPGMCVCGGGGVIGARGVLGGMSFKQAKRARKGFNGNVRGEVAGIVHGVPQHASLFSPVADIPSRTRWVSILVLIAPFLGHF